MHYVPCPIIFSGGGDAAAQSGGGDEMVSGHLHIMLQSAAQDVWASVQRTDLAHLLYWKRRGNK
jgi:hypothetical protein